MKKETDDYATMTPAEVAVLFNVSQGTVHRWARQGILPAKRTLGGRDWRFSRRLIEDILEETRPPDERP